MASLAAWAERYRGPGWTAVPLGDGRRPLFRWVHYREDPTAYETDWERWAYEGAWDEATGVGLLTEFSGVLVVDVDVPAEDASAHLSALMCAPACVEEMECGVSRTQSGRAHLLFATGDRRPEQLPTLSATTARAVGCPDVELKFHGACVPLPPTVTEKGDYAWIAPPRSGGEALDSIPCWVDAIHEQLAEYRGGQERIRAVAEAERAAHDGRIREARANGATVRAETGAEERDRAMRYQAEVPGASEPGRYDALVSLAGRLAARGFSEPSAWSAMVEYGNRCDPPFSERAMRARTIHKYLAGISDYRAR